MLATLILLVLTLVSCEEDGASLIISSDMYVVEPGETLDLDTLRGMFLSDTTESFEDTTEPPTDTTEPFEDTTEPPTDTTEPFEDTTEPSTEIALPLDTTPPSVVVVTDAVVQSDAVDSTSAEEVSNTVYWVKNGEVWHTKSTCGSLSRSKSILSGSVEEAMLAGKDRVCKRCGS